MADQRPSRIALPVPAGRGAPRNDRPQRFGLAARDLDGDWLDQAEQIDGGLPPLRTSVQVERPKTILTRNTSPDVPFDRSVNPYRGCDAAIKFKEVGIIIGQL